MDVGANAKGDIWVIGTGPTNGGYLIYRWVNGAWQNIPGGALRISVDTDGTAWVVNNTHNIFHSGANGQWTMAPGGATDIGVGANGDVWIIGQDFNIYKAVFSSGSRNVSSWKQFPGGAARIAVGPDGNPWVVNQGGVIYRWNGSNWNQLPGVAKDIAVGPDGEAYVVGTNPSGTGGSAVYRWQATNWTQIGVMGANVAAGAAGTIYVTQDNSKQNAILTNAPTQTQQAGLTLNNPTLVVPGPPAGTGAGNQGGSLTGGTLVTGWGPNLGGNQPLVVTGLAPSFNPTNLPQGKYICPLIASPGPHLTLGCDNVTTPATSGAAYYLGPAKSDPCPSGFTDMGDRCAKPASYGRGGGYADWDQNKCNNDNSQGCEQNGLMWYPKCNANFHAVGCCTCSPDCPSGMNDTGSFCEKKNTSANCGAYGRVAGYGPNFFDLNQGGQCWACPSLMHRSMFKVTNTDPHFPACTAGHEDGIFWQSPQFPEPGITLFINNSDIVPLAFSNPQYVDAFLNIRAQGNPSRRAQLWETMITSPTGSAEFKALIFAAMMTLAQKDTNLTSKASQSIATFQSYIQVRRTFLAQDALAMYNNYLNFNAYKIREGTKNVMLAGGPMMFISAGTGAVIQSPQAALSQTVGVPPDDYVGAAYSAAVPDKGGQDFINALVDLGNTPTSTPGLLQTNYAPSGNPGGTFDPTSYIQYGLSAAGSAQSISEALQSTKLVAELTGMAAKVTGGLGLAAQLGGNLLDALTAFMTVFAQMDAGKQYAQLVSSANQPVNIPNILQNGSQDDKNQLIYWWALATSAYSAGPTAGQGSLTNSQICAMYQPPNRCQYIQQVITAAMPRSFPPIPLPTSGLAAAQITVTNGGGYVAWFRVEYSEQGQTKRVLDNSGAPIGWGQAVPIPGDASNIHVQAWSATGLAWDPWKSIIDKTYPTPSGVDACVKVYGTTLSPSYRTDCQ